MGWDYCHETINTPLDRRAAVRRQLSKDFTVLKDRMVGSVYYGAIKNHENEVFGLVVLTSVRNRDYFNFGTKFMDETVGPYYYDCPKSILKLLTPTDNEMALEWRRVCEARGTT